MNYSINDLATRVANCAKRKFTSKEFLGMSNESLLELVKDAASDETLHLSAEVNNTDVLNFSKRANSNAKLNKTFLKVAEILHHDDVLNRAVELLKEM